MITIQQMNYILALNDLRHFQRASEQCFVTQPTLSMQIKKAEDDLGFQIFDRSTNPLSLTNFGIEFIPIIRDITNDVSKIEHLTKSMKGLYTEKIRIGIIPTISAYLVSDMFKNWKEELINSQVIIKELKTEDLLIAIEKKEIDLGILAGPINETRLRTSPIFKEEIKAYIKNHKDSKILSSSLSKLHPWLLSKGNCLRTQMVHFCSIQTEKEDNWNYEGGNIELLIRMVNENGGYTLIPSELERILNLKPTDCIQIYSDGVNENPAREIIAISPNRSSKWNSIEKIIRSCQHFYNKNENKNLKILDWK